jgi:Leucine-rich repeat (LRR) protein
MPNLGTLILHDNAFTGSLPSSLAQLTLLQHLYVNDNLLIGNPLGIMHALTSLVDLFVSNNQFTGIIDNSFLQNHANLAYLDMSHNKFLSMEFPTQLLQLPNLEVLDLSENEIAGKLPEIDEKNYSMTFLSMYGNRISGSIPSSIANLIALQHLDVSLNLLTGDIPTQIGDLQGLTKLYLSENQFSPGPFPSSFQNLTLLTELSMRNTNRQGSFPSALSCEGLRILDLSSNQFSGMIPSSMGYFQYLSFLLLNNNSAVTGQLPTTFENLNSVFGFYLDGTNLTGNFDDILCNLATPTDSDGVIAERIIFADCGRPSQVTCTCGCQCCDGDLPHGCSRPTLENLDLQFETGFDRVSYPDFKDNENVR